MASVLFYKIIPLTDMEFFYKSTGSDHHMLGDRLMVGLRILIPPIGVQIPVPQPLKKSKGPRIRGPFFYLHYG